MTEQKEMVLGIDLGTSKARIAVLKDGRPTILPNFEGGLETPSVIALSDDGFWLVGQAAVRQAALNPGSAVYAAIRELGSPIHRLVGGARCTPIELTARLLRRLRSDAEARTGRRFDHAVLAVPAPFTHVQRWAVREAARTAGFETVRVTSETSALALRFAREGSINGTVLICDLGGGSLSTAICSIESDYVHVFAVDGHAQLGGNDFDNRIVEHLIRQLERQIGAALRRSPITMRRLRDAAEGAKIELSSAATATISLPCITNVSTGPVTFRYTLTRDELEEIVGDLVEATALAVARVIGDAGIKTDSLSHIVLTGGQSEMPFVRRAIGRIVGRADIPVCTDEDAVALGAAVLGGIISGEIGDLSLRDVVPFTIGIETEDGKVAPLISSNTTYPVRAAMVSSSIRPEETAVEIHVVEGEAPLADENVTLGRVQLTGTSSEGEIAADIEVVVDIDEADGIHLWATDVTGGKEGSIMLRGSVTGSSLLSPSSGVVLGDEWRGGPTVVPPQREEGAIPEVLVAEIIGVLDVLDDAIKEKLDQEAITGIAERFREVLTRHGVVPFSSLYRPFDPTLHEIVERRHSDEPAGIVIAEYAVGYRMNDRIIRCAKVAVSHGKE
jgi:molecular chaperone DnaK